MRAKLPIAFLAAALATVAPALAQTESPPQATAPTPQGASRSRHRRPRSRSSERGMRMACSAATFAAPWMRTWDASWT